MDDVSSDVSENITNFGQELNRARQTAMALADEMRSQISNQVSEHIRNY